MPYIKEDKREELDEALAYLFTKLSLQNPGDLNYAITMLVKNVWEVNPSYALVAGITGVLENVKQEFYRRVAGPYEDEKMKENGDVY